MHYHDSQDHAEIDRAIQNQLDQEEDEIPCECNTKCKTKRCSCKARGTPCSNRCHATNDKCDNKC